MATYTEHELEEARVSNFYKIDPEDESILLNDVRSLMLDLRKKNPRFEFALDNDPAQPHGTTTMIAAANVYVEGETFRRGWIGRNNFNDTGGEIKYGVWSPQIFNEKYGTYSYQSHMKTSKILKNAVKSAMAFLDKVTSSDVHMAYSWSVQSKIDYETSKFNRLVSDKKEELGLTERYGKYADAGKDLMSELLGLHDAGHQFINPQITERLQGLKEVIIERDTHKPNLQAMLVWVDGNTARTGLVDFSQDKNQLLNEKSYPSPEDMPVEVVNKISILQVGKKEDYVPDTGIRFSEDIFYVQV